jgi:hypothetical protein
MDVAADRDLGDAEQRGDLGVLQVLVEPQHHRRPLLARQRGADPPDRVVAGQRVGRVADRGVADLGDTQLTPARAPPPRHVGVDHHPPHVGVGVVRAAYPGPLLAGAGERRLHGVLGVLLGAGDEVGEAQQRGRPGLDPVVERRVNRRHSLVHPYIHARLTRGRAQMLRRVADFFARLRRAARPTPARSARRA